MENNNGLHTSASSPCQVRLKKYLTEKPECFYNSDGNFNPEVIFIVMTEEFPNSIHINSKLNSRKFVNLILKSEMMQASVLSMDECTKKKDFLVMKKSALNAQILVNHDILLNVNDGVTVYYCQNTHKEVLDEILTLAQKSKKKKKAAEPNFYMIVKNKMTDYLDLKSFKINTYDVDLDLHYNDDFIEADHKIMAFLSEDNLKGLILLHGKPGTGKTTYIRRLIRKLNKHIIYIPTHLMDILSDPGFLEFIADYDNSILILEDCEDMLKSRQESMIANQSLANLLNLGDGLLSDALKIKVICTFNAELQNIDDAILRKGRLVARYEFKELELSKTQKLLSHLGKEIIAEHPMTLADIYNEETNEFGLVKKKNKIGFGKK